jgi:tRNA (adenine57-N1/adenine58-N1)-methyltransferase
MVSSSPFLTPNTTASNGTLALISLGRDHIPTILTGPTDEEPEGKITNSRFGSFPHTTILDLPWGSQITASNVGSKERKRGTKRKREQGVKGSEDQLLQDEYENESPQAFEAAASGFAHLIPPTAESWTISLPHRTQVVYTPDYSFILQKIRARPGSRIIEAGAGSGSFTHAAARAVFNGYPTDDASSTCGKYGRVFSFEYHEPRFETLLQEIKDHGLDDIVTVTHRDVYGEGFCLGNGAPGADAIFLDLPSPW